MARVGCLRRLRGWGCVPVMDDGSRLVAEIAAAAVPGGWIMRRGFGIVVLLRGGRR